MANNPFKKDSVHPPHAPKPEELRPEDIAPKSDDVSQEPKRISPAEVQKQEASSSGKYKVIVGKIVHDTPGGQSESVLGDELELDEHEAKSLLAQGAIEKA